MILIITFRRCSSFVVAKRQEDEFFSLAKVKFPTISPLSPLPAPSPTLKMKWRSSFSLSFSFRSFAALLLHYYIYSITIQKRKSRSCYSTTAAVHTFSAHSLSDVTNFSQNVEDDNSEEKTSTRSIHWHHRTLLYYDMALLPSPYSMFSSWWGKSELSEFAVSVTH